MTTSPDTMRLDPARALSGPSPQDIALDWQSSGEAQIIGAKISGSWTTAFPGGTPTGQSGAFLRSSVKPGEIIVIGDVDLLADSLYLNAQGEIADNARLILNSLDALRGQTTLLSIRNKTARPRPLVVVEKLRQTAQTRILEEQQALESRLSLAEARLADMEARSVASGVLPQGPTTGDIADARQEVQTTRSRLRAVQDGARRDVAAIKNGLIGVCAVAIPMLILLVGLIGQLKWRRMEARRVP
jgi:ABC-type uncharacterized transport system involved in gliding motility auxiliary subunit